MKKKQLLIVGLITSVMMMSACSLQTVKNIIAPQAQGVVLYDEDAATIEKDFDQYDGQLEFAETIPFKMIDTDGNKTMVLTEKNANMLQKKGLWSKVTSDDEVNTLETLVDYSKKPLLFTKDQAVHEMKIGQQTTEVRNGGNIIIGQARTYADQFLIVSDSEWQALKSNEFTMGILHFPSDLNPKNELQNLNAQNFQLVMIQ